MNMQGAITEKRYGYSVINAFYGFWSAAGILGGLWNAAAGKLGLSLGVAFTIAGLAGLAAALVLGPSLFGKEADVAPPSEAAAKQAGIQIPWRPIILIGVAMCCMYIGDASVSNYSSVYMSKVQHGGKALLPLAFAAYQTMMLAGRAFGDRAVRRFGAAAVVRAGAVVAGLGLLGVVLAPSPALAIAAFAVTGLGFCVVPPMCFSATSKLDPTGSGIAISRVNLFNYAGFVLGAALVGGIAGAVGGPAGWRAAYAAPLVLTLVIVALAAGFEPGRARGARSETASTAEAGSTAPG
jgi:predicted MFS family arabinose efflux permease